MSIKALPEVAVRAIGSSQTLTDPASVVKELVDNAIDARASSIFIEIASNTLDVIQVRDNGHGIAPDDRPLVARRYCTSKIKDENDLARIGGSFLGFRGEALSSAAEMSGGITITTRIDGEDLATALKITTDGQVRDQDHASHPVGTTVRVTDFLGRHPVRKQTSLKNSTKSLAKIKQLLQAYVFARPTVRVSLRILKAKNDRDNWTYAPRLGASVEETALKIVGKGCASQCVVCKSESGGFSVQAYVPRANGDPSMISNIGQYISVDGRPVSTVRGMFKQVVKMLRTSLKRCNADMADVKDPFMYMNIACPERSYDANIEPAKDDVLFENADLVISAVQQLIDSVYSVVESPQEQLCGPSGTEQFKIRDSTSQVPPVTGPQEMAQAMAKQTMPYKSNMYDMDEDDLELLATTADGPAELPTADENVAEYSTIEGPLSSNPWIMAKMTGRTGKTNLGYGEQTHLRTPAREEEDMMMQPQSSPTKNSGASCLQELGISLPTPRRSSPGVFDFDNTGMAITNPPTSTPNTHVQSPQGFQYLSPLANLSSDVQGGQSNPFSVGASPQLPQQGARPAELREAPRQDISLDQIPEAPQPRRRTLQRIRHPPANKPFKPLQPERDAWFPNPEAQHYTRKTRSGRIFQPRVVPESAKDSMQASQTRALSPPPNNSDIRNFVCINATNAKVTESIDLVNDENTSPSKAGPQAAMPGFVSARGLDLIADPLGPHTAPASRSAHRNIINGHNAPAETTMSNSQVENGNSTCGPGPDQPSPKRRRTTEAGARPHRTKSSNLPLERVPARQHMQNLVLPLSITETRIAALFEDVKADEVLLPWNVRAFGNVSALERATEAEIEAWRWSPRLKELLRTKFPGGEAIVDLGRILESFSSDSLNMAV